MVDIDLPEIEMHADSEKSTNSTNVNISKMKVFYFNALIGDWEPFLENFNMEYEFIQSKGALN